MRLTSKGRFAVTAMIDLVRHEQKGAVSLAKISERQAISVPYLEQLFTKLRRKSLVKSIRGPGGGYVLAKKASAITVKDIVQAVDEPLDTTRCGGQCNCGPGNVTCITHHLWDNLNQRILDYLDTIALSNLAEQLDVKQKTLKHEIRTN